MSCFLRGWKSYDRINRSGARSLSSSKASAQYRRHCPAVPDRAHHRQDTYSPYLPQTGDHEPRRITVVPRIPECTPGVLPISTRSTPRVKRQRERPQGLTRSLISSPLINPQEVQTQYGSLPIYPAMSPSFPAKSVFPMLRSQKKETSQLILHPIMTKVFSPTRAVQFGR